MDAVSIEALPNIKCVLSTKASETTVAKENNHGSLCIDECDEDDEMKLRFSDDEDIGQDSSSGYIESQQVNLQLKSSDVKLNKELNYKDLKIKQDLFKIGTSLSSDKDISLDANTVEDNINEEESNMSGGERTMQNSPKYWSNNYDKRWKNSHSSQNRLSFSQRNPHRNYKDWYNQQSPETDKYSSRNNFNNHNNHYNKYRNNARHSYKSPSREKKDNKEEMSESINLKNNESNIEDAVEKNHLVHENGLSNEMESKENSLPGQNGEKIESIVDDEKESKNLVGSEKDISKQDSVDSKVSVNKTKDDASINQEDNSSNKDSENHASISIAKSCDEPMTEDKNFELISKQNVKKDNNNFSSSINVASINTEELIPEKDVKSSEVLEDDKLEMEDISSETVNTPDELKNNVEIEDSNKHICEVSGNVNDQNSATDKSDPSQDVAEETSENENCKMDLKNNSTNDKSDTTQNLTNITEDEDERSNDAYNTNDKQNNDESCIIDKANCEQMDVKIITKPCNPLLIIKEIKDCNAPDDEQDSTDTTSSIDSNEDSNQDPPSLKSDTNLMETDELEDIQSKKNETTDLTETNLQEKIDAPIEEVDLIDDEEEVENSHLENEKITSESCDQAEKDTSQTVPTEDSNKVEESNEEGRAVVHKRRRRKRHSDITHNHSSNELQTENGVRLKRQSARNAEELIRKEILKADEEGNSSEGSDLLIPINVRKNLQGRSSSPPRLKRPLDEDDNTPEMTLFKKIKALPDNLTTEKKENLTVHEKKEFIPQSRECKEETKNLVRNISQEDIRRKLKKLSQEDMEALLLQKIIECITIRGEMGKLREQAKSSKLSLEASRTKCQQLQKQVEGFDMVLKRISYDKNMNGDKYVPPIKINRSVGLQVNFLNNLKQLQSSKSQSSPVGNAVVTKSTSSANTSIDGSTSTASPKKVMKTRSPRRPAEISMPTVLHVSNTSLTTGVSPSTLVMSKQQLDATQQVKRTINLPNSSNILQIVSQPGAQAQQAVVVNSSIGGTVNRSPPTLTIQRTTSGGTVLAKSGNDLIDLTDEEDKTKVGTPITTISRLPRVLQAVPASVALTNSSGLRLVQTNAQGTQIVNNGPRLTYVMQSGTNGPTRQFVLANPSNIRPVTNVSRNISTISYNKQGIPTLSNGQTVRVLTTTQAASNLQVARHPAPFPENPPLEPNPHWKLPPPAPSLKISKVATGIVLSWNMSLNDNYAEICSYQLYAYQEVAGTSPSATLWKKVGDVRALPLPMACTLTQFTAGNNYYFAVRAVDVHSRFGQYSKPGNISL